MTTAQSVKPNEIHVFFASSTPAIYQHAIHEAGYTGHEVESVPDFGIQYAHAGKPQHSVLLLKDEHLSMHPRFSGMAYGRKVRLEAVRETHDDSTAREMEREHTAAEIFGAAEKYQPPAIDDINKLNPDVADRVTLQSGPLVVEALKQIYGDNHPAVLVAGVDVDEVQPYKNLSNTGRVGAMTVDAHIHAQSTETGLRDLYDKQLSALLKVNIDRSHANAITPDKFRDRKGGLPPF